jgi:hypothetical protein
MIVRQLASKVTSVNKEFGHVSRDANGDPAAGTGGRQRRRRR